MQEAGIKTTYCHTTLQNVSVQLCMQFYSTVNPVQSDADV